LSAEKLLRAQLINIIHAHHFENVDTHTIHCSYLVTYVDENGKVGESVFFTDENEDAPSIGQVFYL